MPHATSNLEIEIKLRLDGATIIKRQLSRLGFAVVKRRVFESNTIFDTKAGLLRSERKLLRLRQAGRRNTIAFKGEPIISRYKSREELECEFNDPVIMNAILLNLGYAPVFQYEKFRTEYANPGQRGSVMLDETPIGCFLELEGQPQWIDRTAGALGFSPADFITASYGRLYVEYCQEQGIEPTNMVFGSKRHSS